MSLYRHNERTFPAHILYTFLYTFFQTCSPNTSVEQNDFPHPSASRVAQANSDFFTEHLRDAE